MIRGSNIQKSYNSLRVLKGVSVEIQAEEVVTIVGKSGAGKSTLLHILGTLDQMDSGELLLDGQSIAAMNAKQLAAFRNQKIGFIFQFHHLLPEFSAIENVCIPAFINKASEKDAQKRAHELLEYLGIGHRLQHKPNELSGGEQQRVAIARALMNKPSIVFADEPTGNLDSVTSKEIHQLIFQLRKDLKQTFVIVTHNEELADMSDRKLFMEDGLIV